MRVMAEIDNERLQAVMHELVKVTTGPGEAAAACLMLFIDLWRTSRPSAELSEIAEDARVMILSYETDEKRVQ